MNFAPLDGFSGFDELEGSASVVSDGNFMFVQGNIQSMQNSSPYNFGFLTNQPHYDKSFEQQRNEQFNEKNETVSISELKRYSKFRKDSCKELPKRKPTEIEFMERMRFMEGQHHSQLDEEKRINSNVVKKQMERLSEMTRANLRNDTSITESSY